MAKSQYATRTCVNCGIRKIQPQMHQKSIYVETGQSKPRFNSGIIVGSMLDDARSKRSLNKAIFGSGSRTYKRKRLVWLCGDCKNKYKGQGGNGNEHGWRFFVFWFVIVPIVIMWAIS